MSVSLPALCRALKLPEPVPEYKFHPTRKWRFDWAWPSTHHKVALEIQGAIFVQGRHVRGAAMLKEFEKLNAAATLGWRILYATPKQVADGTALESVRAALEAK